MSSSNRRQPKRSINPAFLVAHNRNDTSSVSAESSNFHLFAKAIDVALMTGREVISAQQFDIFARTVGQML